MAQPQARMPPAGAGGQKMESIDSASNEVKQLVRQLNRYVVAVVAVRSGRSSDCN
jgi:hypothetical protein